MCAASRRPRRPNYRLPTDACPGTEAKIRVMAERARRRLPIFVRGDEESIGRVQPSRTRRGDGRSGVYAWKRRFRARIWCRHLKVQLSLGLYASEREAIEVVARARQLLDTL